MEKFLPVAINGHHNTAKIQHCPMPSQFDMWVDNDVLILRNFYQSPFSKWPPQYRTNSKLSDFNYISYVGRLWCPELIPDIQIFLPVSIFKMATTIPQKFNIVRFQFSFWFIYGHFVCYWFAVYLYFLAQNLSQCKVFI